MSVAQFCTNICETCRASDTGTAAPPRSVGGTWQWPTRWLAVSSSGAGEGSKKTESREPNLDPTCSPKLCRIVGYDPRKPSRFWDPR